MLCIRRTESWVLCLTDEGLPDLGWLLAILLWPQYMVEITISVIKATSKK